MRRVPPRLRSRCWRSPRALPLAGCDRGQPKFKASDITGTSYGRDFALTDHTGKARTLADFRGKVVVLFFGYTQCPDVCPTTLAELAEAMRRLGADAARVQVLFVTVDPERDTPSSSAHYVPAFDPSFLGLYGDAAALERTAKEFKIVYQKQPGSTPGTYTMDHSAGTFVFDPQGRLRVYVSYGRGRRSSPTTSPSCCAPRGDGACEIDDADTRQQPSRRASVPERSRSGRRSRRRLPTRPPAGSTLRTRYTGTSSTRFPNIPARWRAWPSIISAPESRTPPVRRWPGPSLRRERRVSRWRNCG